MSSRPTECGEGEIMPSTETHSRTGIQQLAVGATSELMRRLPRAQEQEAEGRALAEVAKMLEVTRCSIMQKVAAVALDLCKAHSAGVTLLEGGPAGPVLRWRALAG